MAGLPDAMELVANAWECDCQRVHDASVLVHCISCLCFSHAAPQQPAPTHTVQCTCEAELQQLKASLENEIKSRQQLQASLAGEAALRQQLQADLIAEVTFRLQLQGDLIMSRQQLQAVLDMEVAARKELQAGLDAEVAARQQLEQDLQAAEIAVDLNVS